MGKSLPCRALPGLTLPPVTQDTSLFWGKGLSVSVDPSPPSSGGGGDWGRHTQCLGFLKA